MAIGERIHFFRNLRGMTQKYLGLKVGFPERSADIRMAQYESGKRTPKEDLTEQLAYYLDVSPKALDVPDIEAVALEYPSAIGPLGAKGLGEPATCNVAPAVTNAIADACGRRVRDLPADLERVLLGHSMKK